MINEQNEIGFVPSNYVRKESFVEKAKGTFKGFGKARSKSSIDYGEEDPSASSSTNNGPIRTTAVAKYDYHPQRTDELALQKGCSINVLDKSSDGWWKGEVREEYVFLIFLDFNFFKTLPRWSIERMKTGLWFMNL